MRNLNNVQQNAISGDLLQWSRLYLSTNVGLFYCKLPKNLITFWWNNSPCVTIFASILAQMQICSREWHLTKCTVICFTRQTTERLTARNLTQRAGKINNSRNTRTKKHTFKKSLSKTVNTTAGVSNIFKVYLETCHFFVSSYKRKTKPTWPRNLSKVNLTRVI